MKGNNDCDSALFGVLVAILVLLAFFEGYLSGKEVEVNNSPSILDAIVNKRMSECELSGRNLDQILNDNDIYRIFNNYEDIISKVTFEDEHHVVKEAKCKTLFIATTGDELKAEFRMDNFKKKGKIYVYVPINVYSEQISLLKNKTINLCAAADSVNLKERLCKEINQAHVKDFTIWKFMANKAVKSMQSPKKIDEYFAWLQTGPESNYLFFIRLNKEDIDFRTDIDSPVYENGRFAWPYVKDN